MYTTNYCAECEQHAREIARLTAELAAMTTRAEDLEMLVDDIRASIDGAKEDGYHTEVARFRGRGRLAAIDAKEE